MSDEQKQDGPEVAYPNSNPHPTPSPLPTDYSDPVEKAVEPSFVVTPGTESTEERREIAAERRDELGFPASAGGKANGVDESGDPDATEKADEADGEKDEDGEAGDGDEDGDGEPELSDESDDEEPKLPADDSPIHGESTVKPDQADPTL